MKLRDHKYEKLTESNFLEKFLRGWKCAKMAQFIFLPVAIAFFSGLAWRSRIFWENSCRPKNWPKLHKMAVYYSIFSKIYSLGFFWCFAWCSALTKPNYLGRFSLSWKFCQICQFVYLYIYYCSIFFRIGYRWFYNFHEFEVLNTNVVGFFEKILAYPKTGKKSPKWVALSVSTALFSILTHDIVFFWYFPWSCILNLQMFCLREIMINKHYLK